MELKRNDPIRISTLLFNSDYAVERAILAIYNRQTGDEQSAGDTKHTNGRGFSGADARMGSYWARWILSGRNLSGKHLLKARKMSLKYIKQLCEIATERMETQEEREAIQMEASINTDASIHFPEIDPEETDYVHYPAP